MFFSHNAKSKQKVPQKEEEKIFFALKKRLKVCHSKGPEEPKAIGNWDKGSTKRESKRRWSEAVIKL